LSRAARSIGRLSNAAETANPGFAIWIKGIAVDADGGQLLQRILPQQESNCEQEKENST